MSRSVELTPAVFRIGALQALRISAISAFNKSAPIPENAQNPRHMGGGKRPATETAGYFGGSALRTPTTPRKLTKATTTGCQTATSWPLITPELTSAVAAAMTSPLRADAVALDKGLLLLVEIVDITR